MTDTDSPSSNEKPRLLIVDDDSLIVESLSFVLANDFSIAAATSRPDALKVMANLGNPKLALVDLGLPPNPHGPTEGLGLISEILAISPETRIVVLSGQNDEANARLARTLGATDFVGKPIAPDALRRLLLSIGELHDLQPKEGELRGRSMPMTQLKLQLKQFAASHFPVLIEGESGTGKELAARSLHYLSERNRKPYLALNCAAIAPTLVEATLFGHGRGAFTGAHTANAGYFEDAMEGTLFLDEIGELPLELQPKLLRVLENGEFQRIGETQTRRSSARIIAATNRDLREEVRAGRFRGDLYHRLSVFSVRMPPLRELGPDRRMLLEFFLTDYSHQAKLPPPQLSEAAWGRIEAYAFPGNVRELRNIAIRLSTKFAGREIGAHDLAGELDSEIAANPLSPHISAQPTGTHSARDTLVEAARVTLQNNSDFRLDDELRALEFAYLVAAQDLAQGNISQAARMLGLSRTTLYNRIEAMTRDQRK